MLGIRALPWMSTPSSSPAGSKKTLLMAVLLASNWLARPVPTMTLAEEEDEDARRAKADGG